MADTDQTNLTALTVNLLSAYFANNVIDSAQLSGLIKSTHDALKGIDSPEPEASAEPEFKPAVTARKSLASPDHIISLIDGKPYKTLKRHLSGHGLTPGEYRARYKLPTDYPMVAPAYSQQRRNVAEKLGLGRKPRTEAPALVEQPAALEPAAPIAVKAKTPTSSKKEKAKPKVTQKPSTPKKAAIPKAKTQPVEPGAAEPASPKKTNTRKLKAAVAAPVPATSSKPPVKRAPRKIKGEVEPFAEASPSPDA